MEWFHFSDFHIGRPREPQTTAITSLIDTVKIASKNGSGKVDAVFITGDIAHSGRAEEYERFRNDFLDPLMQIPEFSDTLVFAVPGNHDIDCDVALPISWESIGNRNQRTFFSENDVGINARRSRVEVFNSYVDFVDENSIISPNPKVEISTLYSDNNYQFDILLTNTAFFSDREKQSSGATTPSPIDSIRHRLSERENSKPVVILAHHPCTCFFKEQQLPLLTLLKERKAVFLHGHEHEPRVNFGRDGTIRTFGFGACYLASLGDSTVLPYQNSFMHCRLDNDLRFKCYSWQFHSGAWANTTSSQLPECIPDKDIDATEGSVIFPQTIAAADIIQQEIAISKVRRKAPKPTQLIPIEEPGIEIWKRLFNVSSQLSAIFQKGDPSIRELNREDSKTFLQLEFEDGQRDFLLIIGAVNHILSSKEVESINTEMDTQGFSSATVLSLGGISSDAKSMYLRLQARKAIEVVANEGFVSNNDKILSNEQKFYISKLDAANYNV